MWIINIAIQIKNLMLYAGCMCKYSLDNQLNVGHKNDLVEVQEKVTGRCKMMGIKVFFLTQNPGAQTYQHTI